MQIVGWVFVVIIATTAVTSVALGARSLGDVRRYFKIRRM
jgi:hypothetical protein